MKRISILICLLVAATVLPGCSRLQAAFTPEPIVVTDEATTAVSPATLDGELNEGTPEGIPFWPGSVVEDSGYAKGTAMATLTTGDPYDDVVAGTGVGYERAGWEVATEDSTVEDLRSATVTASKGNREVLITITDAGEGLVTMEYMILLQK